MESEDSTLRREALKNSSNELQQWAAWRQEQTLKQLEALKNDALSPIKSKVRSDQILASQKVSNNTVNVNELLEKKVLSKFAKRKIKSNNETLGDLTNVNAQGPKIHGGEQGRFSMYNESDWLKSEVKRLTVERAVSVQEKTLWISRMQDENAKLQGMLAEAKATKQKLFHEIATFSSQLDIVRSTAANGHSSEEENKLELSFLADSPLVDGESLPEYRRDKGEKLHASLVKQLDVFKMNQQQHKMELYSLLIDLENTFTTNESRTEQDDEVLYSHILSEFSEAAGRSGPMNAAGEAQDRVGQSDSEALQRVEQQNQRLLETTDALRDTVAELRSKNAKLKKSQQGGSSNANDNKKKAPKGKNMQSSAPEKTAENLDQEDGAQTSDSAEQFQFNQSFGQSGSMYETRSGLRSSMGRRGSAGRRELKSLYDEITMQMPGQNMTEDIDEANAMLSFFDEVDRDASSHAIGGEEGKENLLQSSMDLIKYETTQHISDILSGHPLANYLHHEDVPEGECSQLSIAADFIYSDVKDLIIQHIQYQIDDVNESLVNQDELHNIIMRGLHSIPVHMEIVALITLVISYLAIRPPTVNSAGSENGSSGRGQEEHYEEAEDVEDDGSSGEEDNQPWQQIA